ncbi:MAG: DUF4339 domain-containing protein [Polyangiaceae bacterium]
MSGEYEVECDGCGQRHGTSPDEARKQRVTRCGCGRFVRLDRALVELRSDPAPPRPSAPVSANGVEDDEATHMLTSLAAVAALGGGSRARATQASIHEEERGSRPLPRGTLRSLASSSASAPHKYPSTPPGEKPLWYVDLGGSETVEMTIEQLIVARRSGKLGEGALVWREGMPRWRPVGTLIPATSIAAARATPIPPAPSRPPLPAPSRPPAPLPRRPTGLRPPPPVRSTEADPQSLASYERPLATLEFALEKPEAAQPAHAAHSPLPSAPRAPSRPPPRGITPIPRPATWLSSSAPFASSAPIAAAPPAPLAVLPPPSPLPAPRATPIPTPLPSFTSDRALEVPAASAWDWLGDRPRWVSACMAMLVCVAASGSGAYLVRSLKRHHQPLALSSTTANQPLPGTSTANHAAPLAPAAAASVPLVVDLQSLSVERSAPRRSARPIARQAPQRVAEPEPESEAVQPSVENTDPIDDEPSPAAPNKGKNADLPGAARANPYLTGTDSSAPKHTTEDE